MTMELSRNDLCSPELLVYEVRSDGQVICERLGCIFSFTNDRRAFFPLTFRLSGSRMPFGSPNASVFEDGHKMANLDADCTAESKSLPAMAHNSQTVQTRKTKRVSNVKFLADRRYIRLWERNDDTCRQGIWFNFLSCIKHVTGMNYFALSSSGYLIRVLFTPLRTFAPLPVRCTDTPR